MDQSSTSIHVGVRCDDIKKSIIDKYQLLSDRLRQQEKDNLEYLLWDCKIILKNISMSCDKLIPKFKLELSEEEINVYSKISDLIKKDDAKLINIEIVKNIFGKLQNEFEGLNKLSNESNNKILKIKCRSCSNEIEIDCSKLPTNIKILDTMCPNCKSFIKYKNLNYVDNSNDKLIEHTVNSIIRFRFSFPKNYGEITKKSDISFKIGNYINIAIIKCLNKSMLFKTANQLLVNSAKINNWNILKERTRKYSLNNTIDVIEMFTEKNGNKTMYKFIYYSEVMIVFSFNYNFYTKDLETDINNAIISIKEISNQEKIERDPFVKPSNLNIDKSIENE